MPSDGKRIVQPKRNEWGFPDTYDADTYNDTNPGGEDIPDTALMKGTPPDVPGTTEDMTVDQITEHYRLYVVPALRKRGVIT